MFSYTGLVILVHYDLSSCSQNEPGKKAGTDDKRGKTMHSRINASRRLHPSVSAPPPVGDFAVVPVDAVAVPEGALAVRRVLQNVTHLIKCMSPP